MATKYVDFGAANDGDGTTYTQASSPGGVGAYKTIVGKTFASGDVVWIRRSATALNLTAAYTGTLTNVSLIGWPLSGDAQYANRPAGPQGTWDGDSANYAKFTTSNAFNNFAPTSPGGAYISRIWVDSSLTSGGTTFLADFTATLTTNYCTVENSQFTYSSAVTGTAADLRCLTIGSTLTKLYNIYCKGASDSAASSSIIVGTVAIATNANPTYINGLTIDVTYCVRGTNSGTGNAAAFCYTGASSTAPPSSTENVTINFLQTPTAGLGTALRVANQGHKFYNILITSTYSGSAYEGPGIFIDQDFVEITNLQGSGNMGCIYVSANYCKLDVKNWNVNYAMACSTTYTTAGNCFPVMLSTASVAKNGNILSIANSVLTIGAGSTYIELVGSKGSKVFSNYTNVPTSGIHTTSMNLDSTFEFFSYNHARTLGSWHYENMVGTLDSSSVTRSGGAAYSIKSGITTNTFAYGRDRFFLSQITRETLYVTLSAGTNTLTLYGCYKTWAGTQKTLPNNRDIGFLLSWFNNSNAYQITNTGADTALTSDSSTWTGATGLTAFKVTATLSSAAAQTVPVSIFINQEYDATGFFYIDPMIVVS